MHCARAFGRGLNLELHLLVFAQRIVLRILNAALMEEKFASIIVADKTETPVADQFFDLSCMSIRSPLCKKSPVPSIETGLLLDISLLLCYILGLKAFGAFLDLEFNFLAFV
jgi:hypothetical protein